MGKFFIAPPRQGSGDGSSAKRIEVCFTHTVVGRNLGVSFAAELFTDDRGGEQRTFVGSDWDAVGEALFRGVHLAVIGRPLRLSRSQRDAFWRGGHTCHP